MNHYTSQSVAEGCPINKAVQVWFSPTSAAYQAYGEYIVGWRFEAEVSDPAEPDFPLYFEVLTKANSLIEVGNEYEAPLPSLSKITFRGSEVTNIRASV